jgi:hypothetical protein
MKTFEARVVKGRLVIDAPSPYPEGAQVRLVAASDPEGEELDANGIELPVRVDVRIRTSSSSEMADRKDRDRRRTLRCCTRA